MEFGIASYGFGFAAGVLSTLSPCVLPIVPILLASALNVHRAAPLALASGLALSFGILGTALAWSGGSLGVEAAVLREIAAALMGLLGLALLSRRLQQRFAAMLSGIGEAGNAMLARMNLAGLRGQFAIGLVLGVVWTPCVGPTLGAAVLFASRGSHLPQVALLMTLFGIGAALPMLAIGHLSRGALSRSRPTLLRAGEMGKAVLGASLLAFAALILAGFDRPLEAWLVEHSPAWLAQWSTRL